MSMRTPSQLSQELALVLHNAGVRTGVFTGVALALGFATWLYAANRVPELENVALERNLIAAIALALIASIPVLRFLRAPGNLLVASLIAWSILAFTYRGLTVHFTHLGERYSTMKIFALGAVVFMILATLSWIGTCLWRLRGPHVSHSSHESHIRHNHQL
jgi:hypothetical protein